MFSVLILIFNVFSSPRPSSSRSSHHQGPTSPPFPPSPHPELVASPKSLAADVFERVAVRSYARSPSSVAPSQAQFPKGIFPRPESSLYYTASLRSFGGDSEAFGGELSNPASVSAAAPANFSRAKVTQSQSASSGIGVLALLESNRRRGGPSGETQFLQRRYTEEWIRRYQRPATNTGWYSSPEEDQEDLDNEECDDEDLDTSKKGHRKRNHSNAKTITQADIVAILREATPIPPEAEDGRSVTEESSDIEGGYLFYKTAPQSMAGTMSTDAPPVPSISRNSMRNGEDIIHRPASTVSHNGTITPTAASSYLAPLKPPTRTNSRASVRWNGKSVVICIPSDIRDDYGVDVTTGRPAPLTKEQVLERLRMWEKMGYNIEARDEYGDNGQSREIYPEEMRGPVDKSEVCVNIPNRREWEAYVETLREEKLRALGVLLNDEPPVPPVVMNSRGQTPMIPLGVTTPGSFQSNAFSPPPLPGTMISTQFNHFSPAGTPQTGFPFPPAMASPVVAPPSFGNFHNSRQSVSFQGGIIPMPSPGQNEWDSYNMYASQRTPPFQGSGWGSPFGRGGSPALPHLLNSNAMNGSYAPVLENNNVLSPTVPDFVMPENMFQSGAQIFAERLQHQHQQVRRGSPLAHVREASVEETEPVLPPNKFVVEPQPEIVEEKQGPTIVEPVPKHRRNEPSISLQREMQGVEEDENVVAKPEVHQEELEEDGANNSGFVTNPVSPAPPNYLNQNGDILRFPDQPEMPNLESDIHIGAELASNDDVTDTEAEANERREVALGGDSYIKIKQPALPAQDAKPLNQYHNLHSRDTSQQFLPSSHFFNSRTPAGSLQAQLQHDYDSPDPIQHSALAMLVAGDELHHNGVLGPLEMGDEVQSEDARTNISDFTNPSETNSPTGKFSVTAVGQHAHNLSNGSNHSGWAVMDQPEIPKARVSEFKYDPKATFMFSPSTFNPVTPPAPPKDTSFGGFGTKNFNVTAPSFTPGSSFNFKTTSFNPEVPTFTPSYVAPSFPQEIVKPSPVKKIIPIVRPPSRNEERAADEAADPRDPKSQEGGRKRTKHELVLEEAKAEEHDHSDKGLQMPVIGEKGEVKELSSGEEIEVEYKEDPRLEDAVKKIEVTAEVEKEAETPAKPDLEEHEGKLGQGSEEEAGEISGILSDDIDEVSSDEEAEALMEKSPTDLIKEFNPYEFKKMSEMEEFANAHPSTTFDHARGKSNRTPDTVEDGSLPDLSVNEASFMIANSTLFDDKQPSPPPAEAPPPPPPGGRRTSILTGSHSFSFEFKNSESKPFVPKLQQPLTPKATSMATSKYAFTPSPPQTTPAAPPSILSPALSNPGSLAASPPQREEEEEEEKRSKPRSLRSKSSKKRPVPSAQELEEIFANIDLLNPPYLNRRPSKEDLHEHHEDEETEPISTEEEEVVEEEEPEAVEEEEEGHGLEEDEDDLEEVIEEESLPWAKTRARPKRPALDDLFKIPPAPPYGGLHSDEPRHSAAPSPMPKHYRHRGASFSPDEELREPVRPAVSSYKPPDLPPVEKYRSTAIGITTKVDSDWDDMVSEGGNSKLHPQSRMFFDAHVEELVGALLKAHVDPLEKSLATIQDALTKLSTTQVSNHARRNLSTHSAESDADDEDDGEEEDVRPPSAKRDPKLEKIKAAFLEALSSTNIATNTFIQRDKNTPAPVPQLNEELQVSFFKATKDFAKKLDNNRAEVEDAMKEFQAILEKGQSGNMKMLMQTLQGLENTLGKKKHILEPTKALEDWLNENLAARSKALEELQAIFEERQSGSMTILTKTLSGLEEAVNAKDNMVVTATRSLENKLNEVVEFNNVALDEVNNTVNTQLETVDESIQATRKDIEEKAYWLGRKLAEATHKLERSVVERQDAVVEIAKALEQRLLDYSLITIENNKALESNLFRKSDAVLETTRVLQNQFDNTHSRQDVMLAETRSMAQRIVEVTKSLEGKMQGRDKVIYEATKNLENRLYERDIAMVMDARQFVEDKLKERDVVLLNVTKTLNDKLQNRDSSVIADLGRSLDERLQERDRAVMEATRRLEEKFEQQDISAVIEATKSLENKLSERDTLFAQATSHLAEKLDIRDISVAEDIMIAFAERLKERDESVVEDAMKAFGEKLNKNQQDMAETRKQIERLINRDHEGLVELTQGLEDALKQRDIAMSADAAAAFQSLEERVMERENNDSLIQELRAAVEEILDKQRRLLEEGNSSRVGGVEVEELQKRQGVLESLLEESRSTVRTEADRRGEAQQKIVELETRLRLAEEERDKQKELAQEAERRLKSSDEKRQQALSQAQMRSALLEGAHSSLQKSVSDLSARNAVLEGSLHDAKASGVRLREDNDMAQNENRELRRAIETLKAEMEESIRVREGFRGKFNKLQEDMRAAQTEINREQARAARRDEEQKARVEVLEARLVAEAKSKEWFEREVERLRAEEREAIRLKVELEHVKRHADKTEELSDRLRAENLEQQRKMAILQVDVENARQLARDEVARASITVQRDIEAANNQANMVRVQLEKQLQDTRHEADRIRNAALQEQHRKYELQLVDIRSHHERTLANAREDADRNQATLCQNLGMANSQIEHLKERIVHLEDKLNIATIAAQAAAQAAQTAKTSPSGEPRGSNTGEKVSPQALRESIVALQEQLGEREARIEELEQKLSSAEKETSKKLKDSDFEVSWLRELLTVRVNELEEITKALQSPTFDREAVRDAAVRLKANLQMEQQVRERATNGTAAELGSSVVANVTELAKQLPLAAAWGSWRGIRGRAKEEPQPSPARSPASQPAAAPATSQAGFLSGFLTPPNVAGATSKLGSRLADIGSVNVSAKKTRPALDMNEYGGSPAITAAGVRRDVVARHMSQEAVTGATPQSLMRRGSYDDDADVSVLGMGFYEDGGSSTGHEDFGVGDDVSPFRTTAYFSG